MSIRVPLTRGGVATGVVLGCLLGVLGLPRLEIPVLLPVAVVDQPEIELTAAPISTTAAPAQTVAPPVPRLLIAERFDAPLANWPNDPDGTAWFSEGAFRLSARQPGHFVAVGVPLSNPVGDAVISAQFRKLGGPVGGGYGVIIRDQSVPSDRDARGQGGRYLVLEVGDRGDIGVWQRDQTHWIDVVPWTHSDVVHLASVRNALVVTTRGAALRFEVNGAVVADLTYTGLPTTGGVGIFVGGDLNQVGLEWLRIEE